MLTPLLVAAAPTILYLAIRSKAPSIPEQFYISTQELFSLAETTLILVGIFFTAKTTITGIHYNKKIERQINSIEKIQELISGFHQQCYDSLFIIDKKVVIYTSFNQHTKDEIKVHIHSELLNIINLCTKVHSHIDLISQPFFYRNCFSILISILKNLNEIRGIANSLYEEINLIFSSSTFSHDELLKSLNSHGKKIGEILFTLRILIGVIESDNIISQDHSTVKRLLSVFKNPTSEYSFYISAKKIKKESKIARTEYIKIATSGEVLDRLK